MATVSFTINDINLPTGMTPVQALNLLSDKWNYTGEHIIERDVDEVITFEETKVNFIKRKVSELIRDSLRGAHRDALRASADSALDIEVNEIEIVP